MFATRQFNQGDAASPPPTGLRSAPVTYRGQEMQRMDGTSAPSGSMSHRPNRAANQEGDLPPASQIRIVESRYPVVNATNPSGAPVFMHDIKPSFAPRPPGATSFRRPKKKNTESNAMQDLKEKITALIMLIIETFKLLMACLLSLFVPQMCGATLCTMEENTTNLTDFNVVVLAFNCATFVWLLLLNVAIFIREGWAVEYLDADKQIGDDALPETLEKFPKFRQMLRVQNRRVFIMGALGFLLLCANIALSVILISEYYGGFRSITVLVTNIMLVANKLFKTCTYSYKCYKSNQALSLVLLEPVSFNAIDPDHENDSQEF
eukprot:GILJ01001451.1.p1 GENE.GILJ01001451.1~~GILJ01001451.1.p1  ORF type:complete len:321 (-),score=53.43 GILJ01001451.1:198-1160(-)